MQIACKKFGCQKAVEVCYWTCKFRRNCKDWAGALEGQPGLVAITEQLENAAKKNGRVFDAATMLKPVRMKRAVAKAALVIAPAKLITNNAPAQLAKKITKSTTKKIVKREVKPMPKLTNEEEKNIVETKAEITANTKPAERKPAPKPARPKAPGNGTVYLLLSKNGKYKEIREAELMKQAANILANPSVRLVKGQYLVPHITFKPQDE